MSQWLLTAVFGICFAGGMDWAQAQRSADEDNRNPQQRRRTPRQSNGGDQQGNHGGHDPLGTAATFPLEYRSIDGSGNNPQHFEWGIAEESFVRRVPAAYADGLGTPSGANRPNVRAVSNGIFAQSESMPNARGASDFLWAWGQFLDHDLTETPLADPGEAFDVEVPTGDPDFDPFGTGQVTIPLDRSSYDLHQGRREQVNAITAYIDASQVYGSDEIRALELRTLDGTGRMKTSAGNMLPYNTAGLHNAPDSSAAFFLAGDIRANEQVLLTVLHTVFVREHNFWADLMQHSRPGDGEAIYQIARAIVTAELQAITYREFLPTLLGPGTLPDYEGYRPGRRASISNLFATAGFRFGHTLLPEQLQRIQTDGTQHPDGPLPLAQAFFRPDRLLTDGLEPYLIGASRQSAQELDAQVVDGIRNFLFGAPGSGGLDLASLNMQRGRDHGLPGFRRVQRALGVPMANNFQMLTGQASLATKLEQLYGSPRELDPWVGFLSERKQQGSMAGRTLHKLLVEQFSNLRDGDRFYYEAYLGERWANVIERQTLSVILQRNTDVGEILQANVFLAL